MVLALFVAAIIGAISQAAVGFGFSLFLAPLLVSYLDPLAGVQVLIVLNLGIALSLVWPLRHHLPIKPVALVAAGALAGLPAGGLVAAALAPTTLRLVVGSVILLTTIILLLTLRRKGRPPGEERARHRALDLSAGVLAGALTAGVGMPGPALAMWAMLVGLGRDATRSAILTLYVGLYGAALAVQAGLAGLRPEVAPTALRLLPAVAISVWLGHRISRHLNERVFRTVMMMLVLAGAVSLLWLTWRELS